MVSEVGYLPKMSGLKQPPPLKMVGKVAQNFDEWIRAFDFYNIASGFSVKDQAAQCALFLHVAGPEAQQVFSNMTFTPEDKDKIKPLTKKFRDFCKGTVNITVVRYEFNTCNQKAGESFDCYLTRLQSKVKDCAYGDLKDSLLKDRIVCGINDSKLREKLLQTADLTLQKCTDLCRLAEITPDQLNQVSQVDTVKARVKAPPSKSHPPRAQQSASFHESCGNCGTRHAQGHCPAAGKSCHACNKTGHFKHMCRSTSSKYRHQGNRGHRGSHRSHGYGGRGRGHRRVHEVEIVNDPEEVDDYDTLFVGEITIDSPHKSPWTETLFIQGQGVKFKLDTGSEADVLPYSVVQQLGLSQSLKTSRVNLMSFSKHDIKPIGQLTLKVNGHELTFQVVENVEPILGRDSCQQLGLIKRILSVSEHLDDVRSQNTILDEYQDVFNCEIGCVTSTCHIEVDPSVPPSVDPPRRIPYALREPVKAELDRMERLNVITKQSEPTPWVSSMTVVRKSNGKVRVCLDPTKLNKALKRPHHPMQTVEEVSACIPGASLFSVLDADSGFWQMELDHESSLLTTFNTPWGRYRFLRLPFGLNVSSDLFNQTMLDIFGDLDGVKLVVDDLLVHGVTTADHDIALRRMLQRCRESGLKLNRKKTKIAMPEVAYVGHVISRQGLKPSPERVRAVLDMPRPTKAEEVHRFVGLVGYLHKFIPNLSHEAKPLRVLLESKVEWHWDKAQEDAFQRLKALVTQAPVLQFYDVHKPVMMQTDASKSGLGAVLVQEGHPIAYGSKALDETQSRYAVIEKEMLAVCFACKKFHDYIFSKSVIVETDHKPLISIMQKPLHMLSQRLQGMRMRLLRYDLHLVYRPGKEMFLADTLSRAYLPETTPNDLFDTTIDVNVVEIAPSLHMKFKEATACDQTLQCLIDVVMSGWPDESHLVPHEVRPYFQYRDLITYRDGILYKGERIIIPASLRSEVLSRIHESHQGVVKCKARARDAVFWPGINAQIENIVGTCGTCQENRKSQPSEPMISHDIPDRPWAKVGTDLIHYKNQEYMLCVDYFSKYPEMSRLNDQSSSSMINALKSMFARHGIPDEVVSDNGPQYASSEFARFADQWEFKHTTISPGHSQSNGQIERTVQTVKDMFKKLETEEGGDPYLALLNYRNTELDGVGKSPAQLIMSRRLRSRLPMKESLLKPAVAESVHNSLVKRQRKQKFYYDQKAGKPKPDLKEGDIVRFRCPKGTWRLGIVKCKRSDTPWSYNIASAGHKVYRRNRQHIFRTREPQLVAGDQPISTQMTSAQRLLTGEKPAAQPAMLPVAQPMVESPTHTGEKPVRTPLKPADSLQQPSVNRTGEKSCDSRRHRMDTPARQLQFPESSGVSISKPARVQLQQPQKPNISISTNVQSPVVTTRSGRVSKPTKRLDL